MSDSTGKIGKGRVIIVREGKDKGEEEKLWLLRLEVNGILDLGLSLFEDDWAGTFKTQQLLLWNVKSVPG